MVAGAHDAQVPAMLIGPVGIGGLGGSGTRVFAALLREAGVHIGSCLNAPLDNLWFTVLFKRAAWAAGPTPAVPDPEEVALSLRLFERAMTIGLRGTLSQQELAYLQDIRSTLPPEGDWTPGAKAAQVDHLMSSGPSRPDAPAPWGWKEPNTHVFLPALDTGLSGFRYVHIVRDAFDMAFSGNTWQARHWGHHYGLTRTADTPLAHHQLRYWTRANAAALRYGTERMGDRFLLIQYEDFCARPAEHFARLLRFLNRDDSLSLPENLVSPSTIGRATAHDFTGFAQADLDAARRLQEEVQHLSRIGPHRG